MLTEILNPSVTGSSLRSRAALALQRVYTQLEAPVGAFGMDTLSASTGSLAAGDPGDAIFQQCSSQLSLLGAQRDALGAQMQSLLSGAEFDHQKIDPSQARMLTAQGNEILKRALAVKEFCT